MLENRMKLVVDAVTAYYRKRVKRLVGGGDDAVVRVEFDAEYNRPGCRSRGRVFVQTRRSWYDEWFVDLDGALYVVDDGAKVRVGTVFV